MARSLDEVQYRPAEKMQTAEFYVTAETENTAAECCVPEEDRTFWTDRHPKKPEGGAKKSKAKVLTAAAILAAAGLTAFAGVTATAELLRMSTPEVSAVQTEAVVTSEASDVPSTAED